MMRLPTLRQLRAIARNGLVWGGAWFVGIMTLATTADLLEGRGFRLSGWELAVPGSLLFALAGIAFSSVIAMALRGRRLTDLHWLRFGLAGGAVSFVVLPTLISTLRFIAGDDPLPLTKLLGTGALGFVFGSIAAAGTLRLAQWADRATTARQLGSPTPSRALTPSPEPCPDDWTSSAKSSITRRA